MSMARSRSSVRRFADIEHALGIKTRLDDRQSAVVIYANDSESAVEAEQQLMELLNTVVLDVAEDISLRDAKYPRGGLNLGFSTCGPWTPGCPLGASKGPRATPEKLEIRRILTKQKYRPYQCCRYRLQRTELKTLLVFAMLCLKSELD